MLTVNSKHELLRGYEQYSASNWDGDGAEAITKETLDYAHLLMMGLPDNFGPPEVSPGLDGSIALEWVPENQQKSAQTLFGHWTRAALARVLETQER